MQGRAATSRGVPYDRNGRNNYKGPLPTPVVDAGTHSTEAPRTTDGSRGAPRRLTFNNFSTFGGRVKKVPLDANVSAAPNTKLWQLSEQAYFYCNKCRRDNIISDSLAVDSVHQVMLCTRCFTRIIRPRTYRPSRIVPFPSLLSWLNYTPSKVMEMTEDIASRPAEAVAPSAERIAAPMISGGNRPTHIQHLPATAMNTAPVARSFGGALMDRETAAAPHQRGQFAEDSKHPCRRVWGSCLHGETCLFRGAPYDLCICFLMGLCSGDEGKCQLLHQHVFDLPNTAAPMPASRREGDLDNPESDWGKWVARKKNSANSAEWQLWNNGPILDLIDACAPVVAAEKTEGEVQPKLKLDFAAISAALKGLKN